MRFTIHENDRLPLRLESSMTASTGPWRKFALIDQLCSFNSSCVIVTGRYPRGPIKSRRIPRRSTAKVLPFSLMYVFGSHALVSCETSFISIPLRETWPNLFPVGNVLSLLVSLSLYVYFFRFSATITIHTWLSVVASLVEYQFLNICVSDVKNGRYFIYTV